MAIPFVRARGQTPDGVRLTHLGTRREALHPHLELYDLVQDPWQQVHLVDKPEHVAIRNELARSLYQHMVETDDPLLRGAVTPTQHETTLKLLQGEPAAPKGAP